MLQFILIHIADLSKWDFHQQIKYDIQSSEYIWVVRGICSIARGAGMFWRAQLGVLYL